MRTAQLTALIVITGVWVALGWAIAGVAASDGGRASVATTEEAVSGNDREAAADDVSGGDDAVDTTIQTEPTAEDPGSSAEVALSEANCEPASADGAVCRFIVAVQAGDPSILPDDDRETYEADRGWFEERSGYVWEAADECMLEGDVTIVCSATATPTNSTDYDIIDFTVQPVGDSLDHDDGATTGIDDYAVISVSEFHQE